MRNLVVLAAVFGLLQAPTALSQTAAPHPGADGAPPPCDGDIANVRLTEISPTGTMEGYLKAVAGQKAWYRAHGFKDNEIFVSRIMVMDPATKSLKYSNTQVLAFHIRPPYMPGSTGHDPAWDAFHQQYRENSDLKQSFNVCMPKAR